MADYNVTITNGSGSAKLPAGAYTVTAVANGYDASTLSPTSFTATDEGATGTFTVSATGTLTFNVNETGASGGTAVTSGTMVMTDSTGATQYGSVVNIDSSGNCVFNNVPFGTTESPYVLYFKQLTSDGSHYVYDSVITVNMNSSMVTEYVQNNPYATQTFTMSDANYSGLNVASATLTMTTS